MNKEQALVDKKAPIPQLKSPSQGAKAVKQESFNVFFILIFIWTFTSPFSGN